jgi:hypothetical protein
MLTNTPTPTGNLKVSRMSFVDTVKTLLPTALTHNCVCITPMYVCITPMYVCMYLCTYDVCMYVSMYV